MNRDNRPLHVRLHARIDRSRGPDACWPFTGATDKCGYGVLDSRRAHRLVVEELQGPIAGRLEVLHSCDNPPCCNPAHLRVGTHAENMAEMKARGRSPVGMRGPRWKLTDEDVEEVFALRLAGWKQGDIAAKFGVSSPFISRLLRGLRGPGRTALPVFRKRGLTIEQIREIRAARQSGVNGLELAAKYGIHVGNVYLIGAGKLHGDKV